MIKWNRTAMPQPQPAPTAALDCSTNARRSPATVMRLARMGSFHQSRLSFMRALLRRIKREQWRFECRLWQIDESGVGRAVYCMHAPQRSYSLVAFAHDLPDEMRSDRVIATAWDATFCLFDGVPTEQDLQRLADNVPKQEAGRVSDRELTLARANRSVRLWSHVIEALAKGRQPERDQVEAVGYLMRTTAVYGSGKFGAADRAAIANRDELKAPFRAEMLTVWLIRAFTLDLVEHLAQAQGGADAVRIEPELRRRFGVGNSTGLGMAPFLLNHPVLLDRWMTAREEALARVRSVAEAAPQARQAFSAALAHALTNAAQWHSEHPIQSGKIDALRADLERLAHRLEAQPLVGHRPWDELYRWAQDHLSLEGQEQLVSLLMEPYPELVDALADTMDSDEVAPFTIDGAMDLGLLRQLLARHYAWATAIDFSAAARRARFWYVSQEKLEPRLGERATEDGADLELPFAVADHLQRMLADLAGHDDATSVADFLLAHPQHRHVVRRVQLIDAHPFAEVQDNLIDADMLPIDLLRCKLSFFGATRFDPRSDRWVRISMYQDAPFPHELCAGPQPGFEPALAAAIDPAGPSVVVRYTLAEIEALGRKAARGSGFGWGLAEEAGKATRWLVSHDLPGAEILAKLLTRNDGKAFEALCPIESARPWQARSGELCPLIAGASLSDRAEQLGTADGITLGLTAYPMLVLPFVGRAADRTGRCIEITWPGVRVCCLPGDGVVIAGESAALSAPAVNGLTVRAAQPGPGSKRLPRSVSRGVEADAWATLTRLAERTLVPATESSRAGAGAGTRDTD